MKTRKKNAHRIHFKHNDTSEQQAHGHQNVRKLMQSQWMCCGFRNEHFCIPFICFICLFWRSSHHLINWHQNRESNNVAHVWPMFKNRTEINLFVLTFSFNMICFCCCSCFTDAIRNSQREREKERKKWKEGTFQLM